MKIHSLTLGSLLIVGAFLSGWMPIGEPVQLTLQAESKLWVEGTSSIHDWTCDAEQVEGTMNVAVSNRSSDAGLPAEEVTAVEVAVPVQDLECGKGTMNKKLRKALDADGHPRVRYALSTAQLQPLPDSTGAWFQLQTMGTLTIAGVDRIIDMTVAGQRLDGERFRFVGQAPVRMSDFGVDPPTALFGTLKTGDDVVVHFDVIVGKQES